MMKFILSIVFVLFCVFTQAQIDLSEKEREIEPVLLALRSAKNDAEKSTYNTQLIDLLKPCFEAPEIFDYTFQSLKSIGFIKSPDQKMMIVNWNIEKDDQSQEYHAYVIERITKSNTITVHQLKDNSILLAPRPEEMLDKNNWYGCLYFNIIPVEKSNKTYYTVLGWDGLFSTSNMKLIDVIHFSGNSLKIGAPIFKMGSTTLRRVFFEFSEKATMSLKYDDVKSRIVFDHLIPETPALKGFYDYYIPDFSYDAFAFENGKWILKEDIIATNRPRDNEYELSTIDPKTGEIKTKEVEGKWVDPTSEGREGVEVHKAEIEEEVEVDPKSKGKTKTPKNKNPKNALEEYENTKKKKKEKKSTIPGVGK